jgi:L-ribulose-5-phosphate 3-epimerase
MILHEPRIGIYEKALPWYETWTERFAAVKKAGFSFLEMSIDESPERLARLDWDTTQRKAFIDARVEYEIAVPSMCLSGHRKYPFGSTDPLLRSEAASMTRKAILLAADLGIRVIQLAGYDVYYEESTEQSRALFVAGLAAALGFAQQHQIMLSVETMDHHFINSMEKALELTELLPSAWLSVYPDVGNLSAWGYDIAEELKKGLGCGRLAGIHLKDTHAVTETFPGQFRDVPFGTGCVDFDRVFTTLFQAGYSGPFLIEMWTEKAEDPIREVIAARRWMFKKMQTALETLKADTQRQRT